MAKQRSGAPRKDMGEMLEPVQGPAKREEDDVVSNMVRRPRKLPITLDDEPRNYSKGGLVKKACVRGMGAAVRGGGYNP